MLTLGNKLVAKRRKMMSGFDSGGHSHKICNSKWRVLVFVIMVFSFGYAIATYQYSRSEMADDVSDYEREIVISSRLHSEYAAHCIKNNFAPYIEHSITRYKRLIDKLPGFPYFFSADFVLSHKQSAYKHEDTLATDKDLLKQCDRPEKTKNVYK